jgi:hypothetical protein
MKGDHMKQRIVVTDVTRMYGDRVCVAGYLEDGSPIRPVCGHYGPTEAWLRPDSEALVAPFTLVELEVGNMPPRVTAPHTEDREVPATGHQVIRTLEAKDQLKWLDRTAFPSVGAIFGAQIRSDDDTQWGRFVQVGEGVRSLGTIRPMKIELLDYSQYGGSWKYRLRFIDHSGEQFRLTINDLAFRRRLDDLRDSGQPPHAVATAILSELQRQEVYLRVGLAREWKYGCYLQITGVYGFPR